MSITQMLSFSNYDTESIVVRKLEPKNRRCISYIMKEMKGESNDDHMPALL